MAASFGPEGTEPSRGFPLRATRRDVLALTALGVIGGVARPARAAAAPAGQLTYGVHVSLAPTWFDPADTNGLVTPFMLLYAMQDAMVKSMPGQLLTPS
ncbi:MAG: hypothetical protein QOG73_1111, partial [Acetobacteraceae bacterium]|nr:hypothetical protein [Acetobacteraceae bacterium]